MSEPRQGETVKLGIQHMDADDKVMMNLEATWYGFDNVMANEHINGIVDALTAKMREFSAFKNK